MIKYLTIFIGVLLSFISCDDNVVYRIEGRLTNLEDQTLYAVFENELGKEVDTIVCEKPGKFVIHRKEGDFQEMTLYLENKRYWIPVFLEKGVKISISGDARYPALAEIKGGRINNRFSEIKKEMASLLKEQTDLMRLLNKEEDKKNERPTERADVSLHLANVNHQLSELAESMIKKYSKEEVAAILIHKYFVIPDDTRRMDELLAILSPDLNDFYIVKRLKEYSIRLNRTALGAEAPNFEVQNIYGESVSLNSFPGKYLLLTFTAPWCDMCQTEDLFLDDVAVKYPKEKLDMLLISLDDNQKEVRKVLARDSILWNLVTDSAGQAAMLIDLYNVNTLPRCFLIDETGKIVMKTDNGMEIKQTLENLIE